MLLDCHTHLDAFGEKTEEALDVIKKKNLIVVANSMDVSSYEKNKQFSGKNKNIISCFGLHPWKAGDYRENEKQLLEYIEESFMIGEIGLDYFWVTDKTLYEKQRTLFRFILEESVKRNKVVTIHTKGAEEEVESLLRKLCYNRVIIHWYSGPWDVFERLKKMGCYFTISVDLLTKGEAAEFLKNIPIEKLFLETDGPEGLEWVNGEYGFPDVIEKVYQKAARVLKMPEKQLEQQICYNFQKLTGMMLE